MTTMNRAVCIWVFDPYSQKVLAVSRKDNKNDFGLPGGKVDPGENPKFAASRELLEETGYKATDLYSCFLAKTVNRYLAETFIVPGKNQVESWELFSTFQRHPIDTTKETGVVAWVEPRVLVENSSFSAYNLSLMRSLWSNHLVDFNIDQNTHNYIFPRSPNFRYKQKG